MSGALNIKVIGGIELADHLANLPNGLRTVLLAKMHILTNALMDRVTAKLSGPVLKIVTGNLKASIVQEVTDDGDILVGRVFSNASVKYAAIHEFGGVIEHPGGTAYFPNKAGLIRFISNAAAENLDELTLPRTRPHDIPMPERSFLRSSLTEMKAQIVQEMIDTMTQATS